MIYSEETPFNSYDEMKSAIQNNNAKFSYTTKGAYDIACSIAPINAMSNLIIQVLSVAATLIACRAFSISYWFVLVCLATFIFQYRVPYIKKRLWVIAVVLIAVPLLIFPQIKWTISIGAAIIGMIIGYDVWWTYISLSAKDALLSNRELFEAAWLKGLIAIKTDETREGFYIHL